VDPVASVRAAVERHPAVTSVELAGALPDLVADARPLAAQWDRLSEEATYFMVVLRGGTKVDFALQRPPRLEPPWVVTADTLPAIDAHFWDWIVWLGGKELRGNDDLVHVMLTDVMFEHLLAPLGATSQPETIADAVKLYESLRAAHERKLGVKIGRELGTVIRARLAEAAVL
jgi:hypothetical protein